MSYAKSLSEGVLRGISAAESGVRSDAPRSGSPFSQSESVNAGRQGRRDPGERLFGQSQQRQLFADVGCLRLADGMFGAPA